MPTIACRDLEIQRRENDLVVATFGRGFYVLDDYTPLREPDRGAPGAGRDHLPGQARADYIREPPALGGATAPRALPSTADNPPFGAVFTYYLKDGLKTLKEQRQKAEKERRGRTESRSTTRPGTTCAPRTARRSR